MDKIELSFELYRTDTNAPTKANGILIVEGDLTGDGNDLSAQVSWERPSPAVKKAEAKGKTFRCGQLPSMRLTSTQTPNFDLVLHQNPFEERISYCGSFKVTTDVYNLSAVRAED